MSLGAYLTTEVVDGYCNACGLYVPVRMDEAGRVEHDCGRTPPMDGLPPTVYACPICFAHGLHPWGCWGTTQREHKHTYMEPIHKLLAAV